MSQGSFDSVMDDEAPELNLVCFVGELDAGTHKS
jgi:hypothetical protein